MTKKIILDVNDDLWSEFKKTVTRDQNLNEAIVELIEEKLQKNIEEKLQKMSFESGITMLREDLDFLTIKLVKLVKERTLIVEKIADLKKKFNKPIEDESRESEIMDHIRKIVERENKKLGTDIINYQTVQKIMKLLISDAKELLLKAKEE